MAGHARLLAGVALVVAASLAGTAAYALDQVTSDEDTPTALPVPTLSPAPSETSVVETPGPTPTATVAPTASPTASASPSATPSRTAGPTASAKPSASAVRYAYPKPTTSYSGLYFDSATVDNNNPSVGQKMALYARALDGDGTIYVVSVDWGDGTVNGGEPNPTQCKSFPSPTTKPGPYQPQPDTREFSRSHAYSSAGVYDVVVTVRSVNADCRPYGPKTETTSVSFTGDKAIVVSQ